MTGKINDNLIILENKFVKIFWCYQDGYSKYGFISTNFNTVCQRVFCFEIFTDDFCSWLFIIYKQIYIYMLGCMAHDKKYLGSIELIMHFTALMLGLYILISFRM